MYNFSDEELIDCVKNFCHYLFECADIEKSLTFCSDDISYYNSLDSIDIVGKDKVFAYFLSRQVQLKFSHKVVFHKYTIQRISEEFAIVHLMAELKGQFWVNTSVTLKKELQQPLICNIHGFISLVIDENAAITAKTQNNMLRSFFDQLDSWKEDNKNLIAKLIFNLTKDTVIISYIREDFLKDCPDSITVDEFSEIARKFIVTQEAKEEYRAVYSKNSLLEKFNNGETKFKLLSPFMHKGKFFWTRTHNTIYNDPESGNIWCFTAVYDVSEELIRNCYSDYHLYSQIDFFVQLNTGENGYTLYPCHPLGPVMQALPLTGFFDKDFRVLMDMYVLDDDKAMLTELFDYKELFKKIHEHNFYSLTFRIKRGDDPSHIRYKQIQFFKFSQVPDIINIACSDITDIYSEQMKKNEILKQALEVATTANLAKNTFLASMSHDLRTPMNAILGMTQLAMEDLDNKSQVAESFAVIKQSSEHLLNLLNDVLEMNKIENGSSENLYEPFSVVEECEKILAFYQSEIKTRKHTVQTDFSKISHVIVLGDKTKFSRIIGNIFGNAVKYTLDGGTIELTLAEEPSKNSKNIAYFTVAVRDTGIGIDSSNIPYIFNPFYREESGKIRKIEGLGLGLSIVKAFVDNLGGTIAVESERGAGSVFVVEIPYQLNESCLIKECEKDFTTAEINLHGKSVLLAEDNPVNILMFKKILEKCGAAVTVAQNGQKAYEAFLKMDIMNPFDIIFMDIQMPLMNGLEASRKIRALPVKLAKEIPIIAVTANAYQEDVKKAKEAGMNAHITKPIMLAQLYQVLHDLKMIA